MNYHYKVDYIGASVSAKDVSNGKAGTQIATQVEQKINSYMANGYELYQQFESQVSVQPGCLAGIMGQKAEQQSIITTVFRKQID